MTTEIELARQRQIERNRAVLMSMGIPEALKDLTALKPMRAPRAPRQHHSDPARFVVPPAP